MDPDARIQVATLGTRLYFSKDNVNKFVGKNGSYNKASLKTALGGYTRIYGLASTPDFGGQPNTIDSTTLDNTKSETSVLGLQPATEVSYEINMMHFDDNPDYPNNLREVKAMADTDPKTKAHWILVKASGVIIEYDGTCSISYTADAQQDIEKFTIYHDVKSDIAVSLPNQSSQ